MGRPMITRIINYRNGSAPHRVQISSALRNDRNVVDLHLQPDWQRTVGQFVEVRCHGRFVRAGTVDDVMPDNSILWISFDGTHRREMYERVEGYQIYARYPWDAPPEDVL